MITALRQHWPEYLMEAIELGIFMTLAAFFAVLIFHPGSLLVEAKPFVKRILMGLSVALAEIAIVYSPWGKRSGAHLNPSVTLTYFRLGKIEVWDAFFYIAAHFVGAVAGLSFVGMFLSRWIDHPSINFIATTPGAYSPGIAFGAEVLISFIMMLAVLNISNIKALNEYTGIIVGIFLTTFIVFESPFSGTSLNPARSFAPTIYAQTWEFLWIYFTAPLVGMFLAAELYINQKGIHNVFCAKLHHKNPMRCIFRCRFDQCR